MDAVYRQLCFSCSKDWAKINARKSMLAFCRVTVWTLYFIIKPNKDTIVCGTVNIEANKTVYTIFIMLFLLRF